MDEDSYLRIYIFYWIIPHFTLPMSYFIPYIKRFFCNHNSSEINSLAFYLKLLTVWDETIKVSLLLMLIWKCKIYSQTSQPWIMNLVITLLVFSFMLSTFHSQQEVVDETLYTSVAMWANQLITHCSLFNIKFWMPSNCLYISSSFNLPLVRGTSGFGRLARWDGQNLYTHYVPATFASVGTTHERWIVDLNHWVSWSWLWDRHTAVTHVCMVQQMAYRIIWWHTFSTCLPHIPHWDLMGEPFIVVKHLLAKLWKSNETGVFDVMSKRPLSWSYEDDRHEQVHLDHMQEDEDVFIV